MNVRRMNSASDIESLLKQAKKEIKCKPWFCVTIIGILPVRRGQAWGR
jgi:hypothetical protein